MKIKLFIIFLSVLLFFNSCSVQENMSPGIFFDRLIEKTDEFDFENSEQFLENSDYICFVNDSIGTEHVFELSLTDNGDINKISLACNKTDKAENFINHIINIIGVYAPKENINEIIGSLTENGKIPLGLTYYETQWHSWSTYSDKNGLFFSVTNKKLTVQSEVEFSLKPNDKSGLQLS